MYKLLIVEDEPLIRAGLKHYFSWEELGVSTLFEAENGQEGVAVALRERPDLVITDIRMPELGGLEMIERLRGELPDTIFIILTGYNDFNYAQTAIRLGGVHAFLLKPLVYEESLGTVSECIAALNAKREEQEARVRLEKEAAEGRTLQNGDCVKSWLEETAPLSKRDVLLCCGFESERCVFQPFVVSRLPPPDAVATFIPDWIARAEAGIAEAVAAVHPGAADRKILTFRMNSKLFAVAVLNDSRVASVSAEAAIRIDSAWKRYPAAAGSLYLAAGPVTDNPADLGRLLKHTERILYDRYVRPNRRFFYEEGGDLPGGPAMEPTFQAAPAALLLNDRDKHDLLNCLERGDAESTKKLMGGLALRLSEASPPPAPDQWMAFLQETVSLTLRFARLHGIAVEGVYSDKLLTLACVDDFSSFDALFEWLADGMIRLSDDYLEKQLSAGPQRDGAIFDRIEAFLVKHIREDVTLQTVADRFFYNPSYLSRLFKTKLGKNYMTFVTEIRIRYAKKLLAQPNVLVSDVCEMCGYKSYKHFAKTFKSLTNLSPTDYRNQFRA